MAAGEANEKTARDRRAVFVVLGACALLVLGFLAFGGEAADDVLVAIGVERPVRQGELPAGGSPGSHRRGRDRDGGPSTEGADAGTSAPHHAILPEIADPQTPTGESDPESYDPGPGEDFIARYQGRSGRLSPHASVHSTHTSIPVRSHMAAPTVLAWTPTTIVSPGTPVLIHAMVRGRHEEDVTPSTFEVTFYDGLDPSTGTVQPLLDADGEYQATYVPRAEDHPVSEDGAPPVISFLVRATGSYEGETYSRSATGTFLLHQPGARLDPSRAAAEREGSDLVVHVPVHVTRPGAYFGIAELWGGEDGETPVAFGRDRVALAEPGEAMFTFLFGGAVIRSSGVDGPYVVRNVRFMQVDSIPPHEQTPTEELLTTPEWSSRDFQ